MPPAPDLDGSGGPSAAGTGASTAPIQCVPNVSEGRRGEVIEEMSEVMRSVSGAALLDVHPDPDHNRTVYTLVGPSGPLVEALEELYAVALERIDLRTHEGVHPRLGAVDVCPFVPIEALGSTMESCVRLARRFGERIAERFELPVFLYREAAVDPGRRELPAIRRGEFEGLAQRLRRPEWKPDRGPARAHPTGGATVIGARDPLIAYNVVLDSEDVGVAKEIARRVRESSGGLRGIKAMGVLLGSRRLVQVSMNVEEPSVTPVHVVVDRVRELAAERGVEVLETELVGTAPIDTLVAAARAYLQLEALEPDRLLEYGVYRALATIS